MNRIKVLKELVTFGKPVTVLSNSLSKFEWDYDGDPLVVEASQIQVVLEGFIDGNYSSEDLEGWANLIEGREDLEYEEQHHRSIETIIHSLANPVLEGEITEQSCRELLSILRVQ